MRNLSFGRWEIESDPETTRRSCGAIPKSGPEECGCEPCLNFIAARSQIYSADFLAMLAVLGISVERELEVYHMGRLTSGFHLYGGWFHFAGKILSGADAMKQVAEKSWQPDLYKATDRFSFGFTTRVQQVKKAFAGLPLVQLEFSAEVPWLIDAREPE
jgi:hypothetical protein